MTVPAWPARSAAVASSPLDPHEAMSPAARRTRLAAASVVLAAAASAVVVVGRDAVVIGATGDTVVHAPAAMTAAKAVTRRARRATGAPMTGRRFARPRGCGAGGGRDR